MLVFIVCQSVSVTASGSLYYINPLNTELNSICYFLALLGAHHILHISRVKVKHVSISRVKGANVKRDKFIKHEVRYNF
jgi:hypothetical protein